MLKPRPTVDTLKIKDAILNEIPISITTYTLPHEMELFMTEVLNSFLIQLNQEDISQYLTYCLNELIVNAKKANTKRVYFSEKNLNLFDKAQYDEGMKLFKSETESNLNYYLQKQKEAGLFVKLILQAKNDKIKIEVRNNAKITEFENQKINEKINLASKLNSIEDVFSTVLDNSEGAGLGLIIIILMLEKIGMSRNNFQIISEENETVIRIILPIDKKLNKNLDVISEEFSRAIERLPQFPQNIAKLGKMLSDPKSKLQEISDYIKSDISLSVELLKIVNSVSFGLRNSVKNIEDAVKFIGTRELQNILYSIGSLKIFASEKNINIWKHAYKAGFYAYNLSKMLCSKEKEIVDDAFTCGLLHDMGKLIFETTHPEFLEKIKNVCIRKDVPVELFEKILAGSNHGEIGAKIAEKWNFPQPIVDVIEFHHFPELAPIENRRLCHIVYLADSMIHYRDNEMPFDKVEKESLEEFNIESEESFDKLALSIEKIFAESENKNKQ